MNLNYNSLEISGGAKLMFGGKQVQRLYYNNELVYLKDMLESEFRIYAGDVTHPLYRNQVINLVGANSDWSNVPNNLKINLTWAFYDAHSYKITKSELLSSMTFSQENSNSNRVTFKFIEPNKLQVVNLVGSQNYLTGILVI